MKLQRPHVQARVKKIQERFDEIHKKGEMKSTFIIKTLAEKFFLSPRTVEDIVYRTGVYGDKVKVNKEFENQLNLFESDNNNG